MSLEICFCGYVNSRFYTYYAFVIIIRSSMLVSTINGMGINEDVLTMEILKKQIFNL